MKNTSELQAIASNISRLQELIDDYREEMKAAYEIAASRDVTPLDQLLSVADVRELTTLSRASIYRKVADGTMPAPHKIGKARIAWKASAINEWLNGLPQSHSQAA